MRAEVICEPDRVLDHMKETDYDVMLLDITMPGMSGIELLPRVLKLAPAIKVIMVSGNADPKVVTESHRLGAFDFLQKPVQLKVLSNSIRRALGKDASG
jgi:DNA-binding NtrC family response regulator